MDPECSNKGTTMAMKQGKASSVQSVLPGDHLWRATSSGIEIPMVETKELEGKLNGDCSSRPMIGSDKQSQFCARNGKDKDRLMTQLETFNEVQDLKSLRVFSGRLFQFSISFPHDRRAEIIEWINQGGGAVVDEQTEQNVHFTVECHGVVPSAADVSRTTYVSSHWIRSCLEDGCLLEVGSHILYSPLPCRVPLPPFKVLRICVSQYDEKDRVLLKNLCFVLGAKFVEKLTKKVTHLLCKFTNGPKYEAACKWGIQSVTCEWIYECVKKNDVVAPGLFCPKEVTSQDQEAGLCTTSQHPTQATRMISSDNESQFTSQSQDPRNIETQAIGRNGIGGKEVKFSSSFSKRARLLEENSNKGVLSFGLNHGNPICRLTSTGNNILENTGEVSHAAPDVAAAIEDLLEQTSK
ncbi:hypothetical protein U1Q18_017687, partial [Sarracenia purpurea var. burkii]